MAPAFETQDASGRPLSFPRAPGKPALLNFFKSG